MREMARKISTVTRRLQPKKTKADARLVSEKEESKAQVVDSNGTVLQDGDTVTLIKDLDAKGATLTAKRGTTVKNIVLTDDPKSIKGRVNGRRIVLVAEYLIKAKPGLADEALKSLIRAADHQP
jgi:alkylphosphonate utilization operon protein PhnA